MIYFSVDTTKLWFFISQNISQEIICHCSAKENAMKFAGMSLNLRRIRLVV